MAWVLTDVTTAADLSDAVDARTVRVSSRAYGDTSTLIAEIDDRDAAYTILPEHEITFTDGGTRIFAGFVRRRIRLDSGVSSFRRYRIECQDYTTLLADDIVDDFASAQRVAVESDATRIAWLFSTFGTKGITVGGSVQTITASMPGQDFYGLDLHQAMTLIASVSGGSFHVDFLAGRNLHYFASETNPAPFGLSDNPAPASTYGFYGLELPDDSLDYRNAVYVVGNGVDDWYEDAPSQALYQRRAALLEAPEATLQAEIDALGAGFLASHAFPTGTGTVRTRQPGLFPGMVVPITHSGWALSAASFRIAGINATIASPDAVEYQLDLGAKRVELTTIIAGQSAAVSQATSLGAVGTKNTPDAIAPGVPTGLALVTDVEVAVDGTASPYIEASWDANAEADLYGYNVEADAAIAGVVAFTISASGTGGALTAGDYNVKVTGVGIEGGETEVGLAQTVTVAAGQRLFVNITAKGGIVSYEIYASRASEPLYAQNTTTTGSNVEVPTEGAGAEAPSVSTAVDFLNPLPLATVQETLRFAVLGGTYHGVRVRATDKSGNGSAFSAIVGIVSARDTDAPEIPQGLSVNGGYRLLGITWQRNTEADLDRYEVRYTPDLTGSPDPDQWQTLTVRGTTVIVPDLAAGSADGTTPATTYHVEIRAVDRSNNVRTSAGDPTPVDAGNFPEAGWSVPVTGTPTLIGGSSDIAYLSILAEHISTVGLTADLIKAGTLRVGGYAFAPDYLIVIGPDGSTEIGRWDANGLVIVDPASTPGSPGSPTANAVRFLNGAMEFSETYNPFDPADVGTFWTTAIDATGIRADVVKLGTAAGGHNAVPNSSFELALFASLLAASWEADNPWATTIGTDVNVTKNTADLTLTTAT